MLNQRSNDEAFALELAQWLMAYDYPIYGVQLRSGKPYPLVLCWEAETEHTQVVACTSDKSRLADAACFASVMAAVEEVSGNAPTGALGIGLCPSGWKEHQ